MSFEQTTERQAAEVALRTVARRAGQRFSALCCKTNGNDATRVSLERILLLSKNGRSGASRAESPDRKENRSQCGGLIELATSANDWTPVHLRSTSGARLFDGMIRWEGYTPNPTTRPVGHPQGA